MRFLKIIVFFLFVLLLPFEALAADYVEGEVLFKLREPVNTLKIKGAGKTDKIEKVFKDAVPEKNTSLSVRTKKQVRVPDLSQIYVIRFSKERKVADVIKELKADGNVLYAEPNYIARAVSTTPDDTYYSQQWGLTKIGMPAAWDAAKGESGIVIAVADTGVEYTHEDLSSKVIKGWNYISDNNDPLDDNGHGTHVAGIAAAMTNNAKGVAGVGWNHNILAVKVLDSNGDGSIADVSNGIKYAADYGSDVINLSLGDDSPSSTLKEAVDYAIAKGSLLVCAAGNENTSEPLYPAAYDGVLAVAATDSSDQRSIWSATRASNWGTWVDLAAPGTSIYSTYIGNSYAYESGTSMASPFVAGVAALLFSVHPTWTYSQVADWLKSTAATISPDHYIGTGRLDAEATMDLPIAEITSPETLEVIGGTATIKGTANTEINFGSYTVKVGAGASPSSYSTIATSTAKVVSGTLATYTTTTTNDGTHTIKLSAENTSPVTRETTRTVIIDNTSPTAEITSPASGATMTSSVTFEGSASDANLLYYTLEHSLDGVTYTNIGTYTTNVTGGTLGTWNTSGLNGTYTVKLNVVDDAGHSTSKTISLTINNPTNNKSVTGQSVASPNPFNPSTENYTYLTYTLNGNFNTSVYLFDLTGRLIFKKNCLAGEDGAKAGQNKVAWNGKDNFGSVVSNGAYIFKVVSDGTVVGSGKIIVLY
ncbi:hypothetical protein A2276_04535 [candidate division WOR-1 bacterium RIFOXYA12_FULL_43_27]|uniref:Uncharacterized protein n=1 Tax=candidate division WOR-1 bacterium RIFOXYC2_FULL_46_14 TaxID=1802587 RepID=A0A1F4U3X1_UNCSA|nr:MAG: hypothetical protein A2276_04535 [candidate division WOR-1 bacterium RIFOXYA12_FULL_43_27]OGC18907.1 MAG: hypothetical protein A2292_08300 [candidate division WOR-1 bacterium RIFOXYB2_FULL_46_45]OGC29048.1 MAG: hypothetical protein A2232_03365 [candidate division WOR-1 bacterium RIFOXYA2_FULL_46_56]OGC39668.1 MAG: hypothetical protein A2438_06755 [candidate division WOR-1 bacterium RIFOXYC2_FULL_46_14]